MYPVGPTRGALGLDVNTPKTHVFSFSTFFRLHLLQFNRSHIGLYTFTDRRATSKHIGAHTYQSVAYVL